jgi:hypothetical protein
MASVAEDELKRCKMGKYEKEARRHADKIRDCYDNLRVPSSRPRGRLLLG